MPRVGTWPLCWRWRGGASKERFWESREESNRNGRWVSREKARRPLPLTPPWLLLLACQKAFRFQIQLRSLPVGARAMATARALTLQSNPVGETRRRKTKEGSKKESEGAEEAMG